MDGSCELERRLIGEVPGLEVKESENGRTVIRGYAAVFESESQDLGGFHEIVERGAFDEVMKSNPDVFGKYNHERVIGRTTSGTMRLMVDERGLRYEIDPPRSAADVVELIERGDVRGSSFAFRSNPKDESWQRDAGGRMIRRIKKFSYLGDAGPVDTPAYLATETYVSKRALEMANDERAVGPVVEDTAQPVPAGGAESVAEVPLEGETEKRAASVMHAQGDFVSWDGGVGRIEHIMEEGQLGEHSEEPLPATPDDPAVLIRLWESEDGEWEETDYFIGRRMSELTAHADVSESSPDDERAVSLKPTSGMAAAAKRGLKLHEEGKSGDGLRPETVARANRLARREEMNPDWVREMNAWFARHESASKSPGWDKAGEEKPGFVAWLLWGGTPAKNWAARKVKQMQASDRSIDYVGKAASLKSVMLSTHLHTK
jgi:HK97 family phage prohead protease